MTSPRTGSDPAAWSPGFSTEQLSTALADRYRIERQLGQGGMATVYLASDLKHDRRVALKVLKPELSAVLGADRFVVEIKTTASLQHPHILPLFDSGSADGFLYYVMPYVEGETLRQKLNRETQFSVDESVRIAREVADALDYAHRHGVVHRDIKPENILLHDGRPMVADFGIALALSAAAGGRMTETGLSLGTPHYMSPEQATADKDITPRSDIYSLGSVLYEMLTGNPPHTGSSAQQIIMKIIAEEAASVTKFRKSVPPHVAAAVAKSLEKVPADRFDSAQEFAEALVNPAFTTSTGFQHAGAPAVGSQLRSTPFVVAASVAIAAAGAAVWGWMRPEPQREVARFSIHFPDSQRVAPSANGNRIAISPDGRTLVYAAVSGQLWARRLDQLRASPLPGTDRAVNPSFSPDGRRLAFVTLSTPRALRITSLAGGGSQTLTDSLVDLGGVSWASDGYIYYDGHLEGDGIARIREGGGTPERVSHPGDGEAYHFSPSALPGATGILMTVMRPGGLHDADIGVVDPKTGRHRILTRGVAAKYSPSGHLLYLTAEGMLMAAPFDANRAELTGDAAPIAQGLALRGNGRVDFVVSDDGSLVYLTGTTMGTERELVWVTRDGATSVVDRTFTQELVGRPLLSPDGRRAALTTGFGPSRQIWVKELDTGPATRVADGGWQPAWSADGRFLIFSSLTGFHRVPADGSSLPQPLARSARDSADLRGASNPQLSPDGSWIVFVTRGDIHAVRLDGDTSRVDLMDAGTQLLPTLSPDGRWLAYASDESGIFHVYVRPFPNVGDAKRQVSVANGWAPRWSRTGRELFFIDAAFDFFVVPVTATGGFTSGAPQRLFPAAQFAPIGSNFFDVAHDGTRFLFTRSISVPEERAEELILVQNFTEELQRNSRK